MLIISNSSALSIEIIAKNRPVFLFDSSELLGSSFICRLDKDAVRKYNTYDIIGKARRHTMNQDFIGKKGATKRTPLANEVANKLAEYISRENYLPGDRIPNEFDLADRFGVGRGTIREAVKLLVARNVLEIRPAKGTFVCEQPGLVNDPIGLSFTSNKMEIIRDMYELRTLLECYAVRRAAQNITDEDICRLTALADSIEKSVKDHEACAELDMAFHRYIAEHCGNCAMPLLLPLIHNSIETYTRLEIPRHWRESNQGHYAVIEALKKHDPLLAEREMTAHLAYGKQRISADAE